MKIFNRYNNKIIFEDNNANILNTIEAAVKNNINLRSANLTYTDLTCADLLGADLRGADLTCADLEYADLLGADLSSANLTYANLYNANLRGANLRGADISFTRVKGFQICKYFAYSHNNRLNIGCIDMTLEDWAEKVEKIGKENRYTNEEIEKISYLIHSLIMGWL